MAQKTFITVTPTREGVVLSTIIGTAYVKHHYIGYSVAQARKLFRNYIKQFS